MRRSVRRLLGLCLVLTVVLAIAASVTAAPVMCATSGAPDGPLGARACFGWGSDGCCKEIASVSVGAALVGAEIAAAVGAIYVIWAC